VGMYVWVYVCMHVCMALQSRPAIIGLCRLNCFRLIYIGKEKYIIFLEISVDIGDGWNHLIIFCTCIMLPCFTKRLGFFVSHHHPRKPEFQRNYLNTFDDNFFKEYRNEIKVLDKLKLTTHCLSKFVKLTVWPVQMK